MPLIRLSRGELLRVYGPMSITVKSGCIDIYGKTLCDSEKAVIHKFRNYIIEAISDAELDVVMINESQIQSVDASDPYLRKREILVEISKEKYNRIIVVGCIDCGKTSFVTMLFNAFLKSGGKPCVIDGDVGQADIGPPGFITLGSSENTVLWISELKPLAMRFIGDTKPQYHTQDIISKIKELTELAERLDLGPVIIDTDGWVRDESGVIHKYNIVNEIKPDVVLVLGDELKGVFEKYKRLGLRVYEISAPVYRKTRSREERRQIRSLKYREFLEKAPLVKLPLDSTLVEGLPLLQGVELDLSAVAKFVEGKILYASRLPGTLYIYGSVKNYNADELKNLGFDRVKIYVENFEKNLYCAVTDSNGNYYPCVLVKIDFEKREIVLKTNYTGSIRAVKLSKIKLKEDYTEEYVEV
ncbi:MAG: Clp1/GlmU family protein [Desulfurococcaceae archaeon]